jgi:hypothetical protein
MFISSTKKNYIPDALSNSEMEYAQMRIRELEKRVDLLEKMVDKAPYDVLIDYINEKIKYTELAKSKNKFGETNFERSTKLYLNALFGLDSIKNIKMKQVEAAMKIIDASIELGAFAYGN